MISLLYWACPNVKQPGFPWVTPGGVLAVILWIAASALFALYVANFSSYNKTYGSLGGVIVFLTWLWITNIIILLGAEFNSEMERSKAIQEGHPPDKEPFLPLRDEPKDETSAVTTGGVHATIVVWMTGGCCNGSRAVTKRRSRRSTART